MHWVRYWCPAIAWAILTWILSTESFSAASTARFIIPPLHWLLSQASPETLAMLHGVIRKSAHFVEYFIFSLLVLRGVRSGHVEWKLSCALATLAIAAGYAALDELNQAYLPARTASPLDSLFHSGVAAIP